MERNGARKIVAWDEIHKNRRLEARDARPKHVARVGCGEKVYEAIVCVPRAIWISVATVGTAILSQALRRNQIRGLRVLASRFDFLRVQLLLSAGELRRLHRAGTQGSSNGRANPHHRLPSPL